MWRTERHLRSSGVFINRTPERYDDFFVSYLRSAMTNRYYTDINSRVTHGGSVFAVTTWKFSLSLCRTLSGASVKDKLRELFISRRENRQSFINLRSIGNLRNLCKLSSQLTRSRRGGRGWGKRSSTAAISVCSAHLRLSAVAGVSGANRFALAHKERLFIEHVGFACGGGRAAHVSRFGT